MSEKVPCILVVDDDPIFLSLFRQIGKREGIRVVTCQSLEEMEDLPTHRYTAAIIDYYLEKRRGSEVARTLKETPIILVSFSEGAQAEESDWPESVAEFLPKKIGPWRILESALNLCRDPH